MCFTSGLDVSFYEKITDATSTRELLTERSYKLFSSKNSSIARF